MNTQAAADVRYLPGRRRRQASPPKRPPWRPAAVRLHRRLRRLAIALGERLGYYQVLAEHEPLTPPGLAAASHTAPRYAREWLEQQAVSGLLEVLDTGQEPDARRYRLRPAWRRCSPTETPAHAIRPAGPPASRRGPPASRPCPGLPKRRRRAWAAHGADMRESEADLNRPGYPRGAGDSLAALPKVQQRLRTGRRPWPTSAAAPAWSCIGLAGGDSCSALTATTLTASVDLARYDVVAGLAHWVRRDHLRHRHRRRRPYDLVTVFERLHDLPTWFLPWPPCAAVAVPAPCSIADMKAADGSPPPGGELDRLLYGFSLLICLPDSMSTPDLGCHGTLPPRTLRDYAAQAGYSRIDTLPIDHDLWRFYHLHP